MPDLHRHGYEIGDLVLSDSACERIAEGPHHDARGVMDHPTVVAMVERIRPPGLVAVKATVFDQTAPSWRLEWHQDAMNAAEMLMVRVQLDDCGPAHGRLRVIPGSHRRGKLTADEIAKLAASGPIAELSLPQGALLFLHPLLVRALPPVQDERRCRVLLIEMVPEQGRAS